MTQKCGCCGLFYTFTGVMSIPDIREIQKAVAPIAHSYGVKRLYLFGSYAKGTANEESDIDLLIEKGESMSLLKLSAMRQMVEETLNLSVDLITTTGIGADFRNEITGTEILLYEESKFVPGMKSG